MSKIGDLVSKVVFEPGGESHTLRGPPPSQGLEGPSCASLPPPPVCLPDWLEIQRLTQAEPIRLLRPQAKGAGRMTRGQLGPSPRDFPTGTREKNCFLSSHKAVENARPGTIHGTSNFMVTATGRNSATRSNSGDGEIKRECWLYSYSLPYLQSWATKSPLSSSRCLVVVF